MFEKFRSYITISIILMLPFLGYNLMSNGASNHFVKEYLDSLISAENTDISTNIRERIQHRIEMHKQFAHSFMGVKVIEKHRDFFEKHIQQYMERHPDIVSIRIIDTLGNVIAASPNANRLQILIDDQFKEIYRGEKIYNISTSSENKSLLFSSKLAINVSVSPEEEKSEYLFLFVEEKWDTIEKVIKQKDGKSAPRFLYICSPSYVSRYITMRETYGKYYAKFSSDLGLNLNKNLYEQHKTGKVQLGLGDVNIGSHSFVTDTQQIQLDSQLSGPPLYTIVAYSYDIINKLSAKQDDKLLLGIFVIIYLLCAFWIMRKYAAIQTKVSMVENINSSMPLSLVSFEQETGIIESINNKAMQLLMLHEDKIATTDCWNFFVREDDRNYIMDAVKALITINDYEVLLRTLEGLTFFANVSVNASCMHKKTIITMSIVDVTQRKEVEKKLANNAIELEKEVKERTRVFAQKLEESTNMNNQLLAEKKHAEKENRMKSRFLTGISHELLAPLRAIIGYSDILQGEAIHRKDDVSAEDLSKIISASQHMIGIVEELSQISLITSGKTRVLLQAMPVAQLLKDIDSIAMPIMTENDNTLVIQEHDNIGIMKTDITRLKQILLVAVNNAANATQKGHITISVRAVEEDVTSFVEFLVEDTGSGMTAEQIQQINQAMDTNFWEETNAPEQEQQVSNILGYGLYNARKLCQILGGSISFSAGEKQGIICRIVVPRFTVIRLTDFVQLEVKEDEDTMFEMSYNSSDTQEIDIFADDIDETDNADTKENISQADTEEKKTVDSEDLKNNENIFDDIEESTTKRTTKTTKSTKKAQKSSEEENIE